MPDLIFAGQQSSVTREIAITMDSMAINDRDKITEIYKEFGVPGTFALIKNQDVTMHSENKVLGTLRVYFENDFAVMNHTTHHRDANVETFEEFRDDVTEAEVLLNEARKKGNFEHTKYFRFPYLSRGRTYDERVAINDFLIEEGYKVAPITIDTIDWKFEVDYLKAIAAKDNQKMKKIEDAYLDFTKHVIVRQELWSQHLLNRNPKHILLIHGAKITINNLRKILTIFKDMGYKFISLDEAMEDEIYKVDTITECRNDGGCSGGSTLTHLGILANKESFVKMHPELFVFPSY